jgi:hypothetical protein
LVLGVDGAIVFGAVDGPALDCACAKPAIPSAAVSATAAVRVRVIGVLLIVETGRAHLSANELAIVLFPDFEAIVPP